ncbi:MAG: hypothetical protein JRJ82_13580 [Deltaproteobacteria bacterium]|nr:hypothetical protein [Deltaproteobacteria bacterium]
MNQDDKEIKANLEYLRKLFIMPDSPDKFIEFGQELLEMIHDFFREKEGIHSSISLPELSRIFDQTAIPDSPRLIKDVLAEIKENVIAHSVKVGNPYYIGHMISAVPYFMILLEMIIAALNQNQVKIETAKVQNPRVALGNVTSDGTLANLTALMVAREKAFPPDGDFPGIRMAGVDRALKHYGFQRGVILVSSRGHYSIKKAANILGMGEENVLNIPADKHHKMDTGRLSRRLKALNGKRGKERTKVIAIVGIAGTTETGNVDNLHALAEASRDAGAHFHVMPAGAGPRFSSMRTGPCSRELKKRILSPLTPINCSIVP